MATSVAVVALIIFAGGLNTPTVYIDSDGKVIDVKRNGKPVSVEEEQEILRGVYHVVYVK
jgi:hypothetical protein